MIKDHRENIRTSDNVDLAFYIATSIGDQSSEVIFAGDNAEELLKKAFNTEDGEFGVKIKELVSRKKQFVPALLSVLDAAE